MFEMDGARRQNRAERVKRMFGLTDEQLLMTLDDVEAAAFGGRARVSITLAADVPEREALALVMGKPIGANEKGTDRG